MVPNPSQPPKRVFITTPKPSMPAPSPPPPTIPASVAPAPAAAPPPPKWPAKRIAKYAVGAFFVLIILGAMAPDPPTDPVALNSVGNAGGTDNGQNAASSQPPAAPPPAPPASSGVVCKSWEDKSSEVATVQLFGFSENHDDDAQKEARVSLQAKNQHGESREWCGKARVEVGDCIQERDVGTDDFGWMGLDLWFDDDCFNRGDGIYSALGTVTLKDGRQFRTQDDVWYYNG